MRQLLPLEEWNLRGIRVTLWAERTPMIDPNSILFFKRTLPNGTPIYFAALSKDEMKLLDAAGEFMEARQLTRYELLKELDPSIGPTILEMLPTQMERRETTMPMLLPTNFQVVAESGVKKVA